MRLLKTEFRGVTRFTDPVAIDWDACGPGLIALVGPNGAGKTSVMEASAANWKRFPTRPGHLHGHCQGKDAYIANTWRTANGAEVTVRLAIDAVRRKTEGLILLDGAPITDGGARSFQDGIRNVFGSWDLFTASVFAAQDKSGNMLGLSPAQRKSLFVELMGLDVLASLCDDARQQRDDAENRLGRAEAVVETIEHEISTLPELVGRLGLATADVVSVQTDLDAGRQVLERSEAQLSNGRSAAEQIQRLEVAVKQASRNRQTAEVAEGQAREAVAMVAVSAAALRTEVHNRNVDALEQEARDAFELAETRVRDRMKDLRDRINAAPDRNSVNAQKIQNDSSLQNIKEADAKRANVEAERVALDHQLSEIHSRLKTAQDAHATELVRLKRQTELLGKVPCVAVGKIGTIDLPGTCPLLADANQAAGRLVDLGSESPETNELLKQIQSTAEKRDRVVTWLEDDEPDRRWRSQAIKTLEHAQADLAGQLAIADSVETLCSDLAKCDSEIQVLTAQLETDLTKATQAQQSARKALKRIDRDEKQQTTAAQQRLADASTVADRAGHDLAKAEEELEAAITASGGINLVAMENAVTHAKSEVTAAEQALRNAERDKTVLETKIEHLREREQQAKTAAKKVDTLKQECGDWGLLHKALGRDGVQALEIDAAGPEVSSLTNELLEVCYGGRWSVSLETLREKKSQPGEFSESFDIHVYDGGQRRAVEALSGGEKVIVSEAVSLALAIFNSRKNSIRYETLWRDETAGALDPEHAQAYIAMLRRALELGGYHQCIFVAHLPAVYEAADVRLIVGEGGVQVAA